MQTQPQVSVIIVNYNAGDILKRSISSCINNLNEIIVVDNASTDDSLSAVKVAFNCAPNLRILENNENIGFARACNLGASFATGTYLLFLNPDCIVRPGALNTLHRFMEDHPDVGMSTALILNPDGSEQAGCRRRIPSPWLAFIRTSGLWRLKRWFPNYFSDFLFHLTPLPEHPVQVDAISGACMFVRRTAMERVGPMDERYFLHAEDLDWCVRFRQCGFKICLVPHAQVIHLKGICSTTRPLFVEWHKHKSMILFYEKFYRNRCSTGTMWLINLSIRIRFALKIANYAWRALMSLLFGATKEPPLSLLPDQGTARPQDEGVLKIGVLGATSFIGIRLVPLLVDAGWHVVAYSRQLRSSNRAGAQRHVEWRLLQRGKVSSHVSNIPGNDVIPHWVSLVPMPILPSLCPFLKASGAKRIVALSTTSRFTKLNSADPTEQNFARQIADAETRFFAWAQENQVVSTILRPTMVYGCAGDRNVSAIARFVRRYRFFPIVGQGIGLRQPVHVKDVAFACVQALQRINAGRQAYNLSGAELLSYREVVQRVFAAYGLKPRFLSVSPWLFRLTISCLRHLPSLRHWSPAMIDRMNLDLNFEHDAARRDLGFSPRRFFLNEDDIP